MTPASDGSRTSVPTRGDPALVKALARAFRYQKLLDEGRYASISELAKAEKIERGYLGTLLRLTLLAPDLVEAILDEEDPIAVPLPQLLAPAPAVWAEQRAIFDASGSANPDGSSPGFAG